MRNRILTGLLLVAMTLTAQKRTVTDAEVKRVHASALLIDTHNDFPTEQAGQDRPHRSSDRHRSAIARWRIPIWRG